MPQHKYRPLLGRVLIEREIKEKSAGGIIIPDAKRHAASTGKILAIGETAGFTKTFDDDGNEKVIRVIKVGDEVIFGKHAGTWLDKTYSHTTKEDDATFFLVQDEDILAVVNEGV